MKDITLAVQIHLAMHIGLIAVTVTLILWRIADTKDIIRQNILLRNYNKTGFGTSTTRIVYMYNWFQLCSKFAACIITILVFYYTIKYIRILEKMVGSNGFSLDFGVYDSLWHQSEQLTKTTITYTALVSISFFIDYLISLFLTKACFSSLDEKEIPRFSHARIIPKEWHSNPEALWENRIKQIAQGDLQNALKERQWLKDWPTWTKCVLGYEILTSQKLNDRDRVCGTKGGFWVE